MRGWPTITHYAVLLFLWMTLAEKNAVGFAASRFLRNGAEPKGWKEEFREMVFPIALTLNFGAEFAHTECLQQGPTAPPEGG